MIGKIFYIFLTGGVFVYYLLRIIKKAKNPVFNGIMVGVFGMVTLLEIIPLISKILAKFI